MSEDATAEVPDAGDAASTQESARVMGMLSGHVPLSLIMDLAAPQGPPSDDILDAEGSPDDPWWEQT